MRRGFPSTSIGSSSPIPGGISSLAQASTKGLYSATQRAHPSGTDSRDPTATVRDLLKSPYAVPRLKGVIVTRMEMGSSLPSSQNRDPVSRTLCAAVREFYVVGVLGRPGERDLAPVCNLIRHPGRCRERNHFGNGVRTGWICGNAGGTKDTARIKGRITFHSSRSDRDATLQPRSRLRVLNSPKSNAAS